LDGRGLEVTYDLTGLGNMGTPQGGSRKLTRAQRDARRHSLIVRVLKIVFPGIGILIFLGMAGLITAFNYLSSLGLGAVSLTSDGLVMHRPVLSGHDGERSYKVTATRAIQRLSDPNVIDLDTIQADITLNERQGAKVTALKGTFDNSGQTLRLFDGVRMEWSEGYTIDTSEAAIDLDTGAIKTDEPIAIRSEKGSLRSGQVSYDQEGGKVKFSDGVKMTINPTKQGQQ
jgi:lipopolysaccharide export system protein LptC